MLTPKRPQVYSLRARVLAIVLVIFSPLFGLIALNYQEQRAYAEEKANTEALLITQNLATQHSQEIESAQQLLITLAEIPIVQTQNIETCNEVFARLLEQYAGKYSNIAQLDLEGTIICSSLPEALGLNYGEEQWFKDLTQTRQITFDSYRIGRITGLPVLPINYPVLNAQGELTGVVSVTLSLEWFSTFLSISSIPPQTNLTVLDRNDIILARFPDPETWVGKTHPNQFLIEEIHQRNGEGNLRTTGLDGKSRLYGFAPLQPTASGVYITVGIAEEVAFKDANNVRNRSLIVLFIAIVLTFVLAWIGSSMIVRPVNHLVKTSHNLSTGDLRSRVQIKSSIAELDQLAETFNSMADSIEQRVEQRTRELREANEKLQEEIRLRRRIERQLTRNAIRLRQSNAALENFAYIASHDLQEPLRKVQAFGSRLQGKYHDVLGQEGDDYLNRMMAATSRMQQLIRDLLSYSRVSSQVKPFVQVDLNQIVKEVITTDLDTQLEETGGKIELEKLPTLEAEPSQMHQLFLNLLHNALKYHHPERPPHVKISVSQIEMDDISDSPGGKIKSYQISVQDNGIGFDEKYADRIFNLFERLHGRSEYDGTGIGLAICRKIIERHNGTIIATSEAGVGSKFIVTLPANQDEGNK